MSTINVDIVNPETGTKVTVNQVEISQPIVGTGTAPFRNTIIGTGAGASLTTGPSSTSGTMNVVLGTDAFRLNTTGRQNTIIGEKAFELTTGGDNNTVVGNFALNSAVTTGKSGQTAIGAGALLNFTAGVSVDPLILSNFSQNTALGSSAGDTLLTGAYNTFIGQGSSANITSGIANTVIGSTIFPAGLNAVGNQNTFLGRDAGFNFNGGNNNTYLGAKVVTLATVPVAETGNNNILVGVDAFKATPSASNSITLGNSSNSVLRCAVTSITSLSDARDKEDIKDLSTGLDFVKSLRPVEFTWKDRDENGKQGIADFGFIAQDLKKSQEDAKKAEVLKLVYDENPEKLEASYGKLIPILVKAIKELTAKVEQLEK